jgi:hypothetical protein
MRNSKLSLFLTNSLLTSSLFKICLVRATMRINQQFQSFNLDSSKIIKSNLVCQTWLFVCLFDLIIFLFVNKFGIQNKLKFHNNNLKILTSSIAEAVIGILRSSFAKRINSSYSSFENS